MVDAAPRATAPLRDRIPALRPAQAETLRKLFASAQCWPLQDERMLCVAPGRKPGGLGGVFELDGDGTAVAVRFDRNGLRAADAAGQALPEWSDYRGRARLLAWSLAYEQPLVRLSEALGLPLLPVAELAPDADADAGHDALWLAFSIEDMYEVEDPAAAQYHSGELRVPTAWLGRMLARTEPLDPDHPQPDLAPWQALPAPVSIRCTGPTLTATAWTQLRPGDVLVLGTRSQPPRFEARANGRRWPVVSAAHGWQVEGAMQSIPTLLESSAMTEHDTPDATDATEDGGADAATRNLPVLVEFELGRLELTMGELAGLQPGYVFALPGYVEGANVTIRANGRVSGRGEVVAVGDTLGVRLLSWS